MKFSLITFLGLLRVLRLLGFLGLLGLLALLELLSCTTSGKSPQNTKLPRPKKLYNTKLYSRGIDDKEIATLFLKYDYGGLNSPENYFQAQLFSIAKPIEKIQVPPAVNLDPQSIILPAEIPPQFTQPELGYLPHPSWKFWKDRKNIQRYIKIQTYIANALFDGALIYKAKVRQPFQREDERLIERILFISFPDELGNILSIDFFLFPSKAGYFIQVDLRPAKAFYRRIPVGTPTDKVANILGDSEEEALFHNQTLIGKQQFY